MGTTSDKLTYLATTKTKIKDAINLGDTNITTETFRQYEKKIKQALINTMLDKWGIWDNFEKVTGTNTSLSLSPTSLAPISIDLKGNTQQDSTTGKNLFNKTDYTNLTLEQNNSTITKNSNKISFVTTANNYSGFYVYKSNLANYIDNYSDDTTYTISFDVKANQTTNMLIGISGGTQITDTATTTIKRVSFTSKFTNNVIIYSTQKRADDTIEITNIMISTSNDTTYEPYTNGASPNPDYPQEIHNVSGDNTIEICGKNLFNPSKFTTKGNVSITSDGIISSTAGSGDAWGYNNSQYKDTLQAGTYKIRVIFDTQETISWGGVCIFKSNGTSLSEDYNIKATPYKIYTITLNEKTNIGIMFKLKDGICRCQLEKGNEATTYEPYTGQSQLISLGVENLVDYDNNALSGYIRTGQVDIASLSGATTYWAKVQPNTTYTMSRDKGNRLIVAGSNTQPSIGGSLGAIIYDGGTSTALTYSFNSGNYQYIALYLSKDSDQTPTWVQLEKGSKANSYSPYGTIPIELNKIPNTNYQDYFYKTDKWYLHKEIGKVIYNGTESWTYGSNNQILYTSATGYLEEATITCLSNYYTAQENVYSASNVLDKRICFRVFATTPYLYVKDTTYTSGSDFETWLSTHNLILYYVLATPTNTEITDSTLISQLEAIKNMNSYDGTTNISQENNDEPFILDVTSLEAI